MADYYTAAIMQPYIPKDLITEAEEEFLALFGFESMPSGVDREMLYFAAEEYIACNEDENGNDYEEEFLFRFLQALIKSSKGRLTWISLEFAYTCSKLRPDGFGGAATFITAEDTQWVSTAGWLERCIGELEYRHAQRRTTRLYL